MRKNIVLIALSVFCLVPASGASKNSRVVAAKRTASKVVHKVSQPLRTAIGWTQRGTASFYKRPQKTAWGGWYNPWSDTMAHRTLPKGTMVKVTYHRTGRSTILRVNDRGPYYGGRIADLSQKAAHDLGMVSSGIGKVTLEVVPKSIGDQSKVISPIEIQAPERVSLLPNNLAMANVFSLEREI